MLKCHTHIHDAIWHAELGSGAAVLAAGYNLNCLMLRYQVQELKPSRAIPDRSPRLVISWRCERSDTCWGLFAGGRTR